jgi:hypothetical protein
MLENLREKSLSGIKKSFLSERERDGVRVTKEGRKKRGQDCGKMLTSPAACADVRHLIEHWQLHSAFPGA